MKKRYLECDCNGDHAIVFASDKNDRYGDDLYVYATLQTHNNFWKRLRLAYRFLFRKDYLDFPYMDLMINERHNDKIRELIKFLQEHIGDEQDTIQTDTQDK